MNLERFSSAISTLALMVAVVFAFSGSAFAATPQTWAFKGTITDITPQRIELTGMNSNGMQVWPKFHITYNTVIKNGVLLVNADDQTRMQVTNDLHRGSVVTVWYSANHEAWVIQNMAPQGQGDTYGPGDCETCGGSTN